MKRITPTALFICGTVMTAVPVANADKTTDIAYLQQLDKFGIHVVASEQATFIEAAHDVCDNLAKGDLLLSSAMSIVSEDVPQIGKQALVEQSEVVGSAIQNYCASYMQKVH